WARSASVDAYGMDVQAHLPGRVASGLRYTFTGDGPGLQNFSVHAVEGGLAYATSSGPLSLCPVLGVGYEDGEMALGYTDPETQTLATIESSWRAIEVPATLNLGFRIAAASNIVVMPFAQAGGMYWRFDGRDTAVAMIDGRPQTAGSEFSWLAGAGLTLGWNRLYVAGRMTDDSRERFERKWSFSVGWLVH